MALHVRSRTEFTSNYNVNTISEAHISDRQRCYWQLYDRQPESQGPTELVLVGSGSYEQSWRAIPTQRPGPRDMYPVLSGNLQVEHHSRVSRHQGGQRGGLWSSPAPTLHIPRITAQLCNRDRGVDNYVCRLGAMFIFRIFRTIHRAPIHNIQWPRFIRRTHNLQDSGLQPRGCYPILRRR